MSEQMEETLGKVVNFIQAGQGSGDVLITGGESFSLSAQNGAIDKYSLSGTKIIGVRVIKDDRVGISYSESFEDDSLKSMVSEAFSNAKYNDVNPHEKIVAPKSRLQIDSSVETQEVSTQKKVDLTLSLEKEVKKKSSEVKSTPYNGLSEAKVESYYLNTNGCYCEDKDHYYSFYTSALLQRGKVNSMHYHSDIAKRFQDIEIDQCVDLSFEHAKNWLEAGPVPTGRYDVIFSVNALASLFSCFQGIFSSQAAREKKNPLFEKLGSVIAHPELSLSDLPKFDQAFSHYHFDDEGLESKDLILIEKGIFKNLYYNSSTAHYFEKESTAHGRRSCKSGLSLSGTNLVIDKGQEATPTTGSYLELHSLAGLHSGSSFISGDFSFGASGYLCENGKRIQPVKDLTVAGNFYKALQEITCIGQNIEANSSKSFFSPEIRFAKLSVAGK